MEKTSTQLRRLLEKGEFLTKIGIGTAQQALLVEKLGFQVIGISGAMTSTIVLGLPDAGFITLTELVENVERICSAVHIPAIVDCDTGFGNAVNVRRTVTSVIRAGAAGLFIEDQVAPKRCGFVKGKEIIPLEEAVGKYRAAVDVRNELDPDVIIMARTDARGAVGGSIEEVIRRGKAYLEAGVDIFYAEAMQTREEIRQVRDALPDCWLFCTPFAIQPPLTQKEMEDLGLCMTLCLLEQPVLMAMYDYLMEIKTKGPEAGMHFNNGNRDHPMSRFGAFDLAGFPQVVEWEKKYLPAEKLDRYEKSIGQYDPRETNKLETE
jgi:2-methylisocitrate lyase-like PEP mutase family enzyme